MVKRCLEVGLPHGPLCPWETWPQLPWTGRATPCCSPNLWEMTPPHGIGEQCPQPTGKGRAGEQGVSENSSVILGKSTSCNLAGGDISTRECADCVPFGSLTSIPRPRDTGGGLRLEGADTAKVHRADKWPDADEGCPGAQMLEISSKQTDRQTHIHTRARVRTHTSWSPCHPAGVILITEDSHLKLIWERGQRILVLNRCWWTAWQFS